MTTKILCPHCGQRISAPADTLGTVVQCPTCAQEFTAQPMEPEVSPAAPPPEPFSLLGLGLAWVAMTIGVLLFAGSLAYTIWLTAKYGDFKPGIFVVLGLPGFLWIVFALLYLRRRQRFVVKFWLFLWANLLLGVGYTFLASSASSSGDRRVFAMLGLGFIFGTIFLLLPQSLLVRDRRKEMRANDARAETA
jgi:hypothetical protein